MSRRKLDFDCPYSVRDNLVKDHVGGTLRKEWLLYGTVTTDAAGDVTVSISTLSGGLIEAFDDYFILGQKLTNAAVTEVPRAEFKTSRNFIFHGDANSNFSIIILGYEFITKKTGKWANQYCQYCKDLKFKALIGGVVNDQVASAFAVTCNGAGAGNGTFETATQQTGRDVDPDTGVFTYRTEGAFQNKYALKKLSQTYAPAVPSCYGIFIAPVAAPGTIGRPTAFTKTGFTMTGGANLKYDVLVFGEIEE